MKVFPNSLLFIFLCLLLTTVSCKKNDDDSQKPGSFRKDIFNCVVNGSSWDPAKSESGYTKAYIIDAVTTSGKPEYFVTLIAGSHKKNIVIHLSGVKGTGTYFINQDVPPNVLDIFVYTMFQTSFAWYEEWWKDELLYKWSTPYLTSAQNDGQVSITEFNMEPAPVAGTYHGFIAGTFWLSASHNGNEIADLKDGKFKIEYWK
jgi:hypothetical protein